jgi:hypothetical protein
MTWRRPRLNARADRKLEKRDAARRRQTAQPTEPASTPQDGLLRAVETGTYEALVAKARPVQPIAMVTPEEREAERRAAGKAVEDKPKRKPKARPRKKKLALEPGMPTEPTPGMLWAEEHTHWGRRGLNRTPNHPVGRCLTEYDPLTGALIGDGYRTAEDDEW